MFRSLLQSMVTIGLLGVLIVLAIINIWQQNNIEHRQIQIQKEQENAEGECVSTGNTTTEGENVGPWSKYTLALQDENNLLQLDDEEWLPENATKGGTLFAYLTSDPKGLNFLTQNGSDVSELQTYIGIGLMRRHFDEPAKYHPELAYSFSRSDDFLIYTFHLRDDIFWHTPTWDEQDESKTWLFEGKTCRKGHFINNRCRVTAHDLEFMMDMMMNSQVAGAAPTRSYYSNLDYYMAIDDFTFQVKFTKKTQTQDKMIRGIYPMPEYLYAYNEDGVRYDDSVIGSKFEAHWYDPNTIGAGPYRFITFEPGVKIVLERDPRYPLGGNAYKEILFQIISDDQQRVRKMKNQDLHFTGLSPSQYRVEVAEGQDSSPFKNGTFGSDEYWSHTYFYIGWNSESVFFNDKKVRNAMSHAFHADVLLEDVMMGLGRRCTGPIPAFLPYYNADIPPIAYDLEKAKSLLEETGWIDSDGDGIREKMIDGQKVDFAFSLTIYGSSPEYKTIGNIFKEDLQKIGVKLNVQPTEWSMLLKKVDSKEFDAVTLAWVSGPDVDFRQIWHSEEADKPQSSNYISFRSEEADEIIEALEVEFDYDKRVELAHRFHKLIYEEQPYTFFYTRRTPFYWQKELQGTKAQLVRPYLNVRAWYLQQ